MKHAQKKLKIAYILTKVPRKFNIKFLINLNKMKEKDNKLIDNGCQKKIYWSELKYSLMKANRLAGRKSLENYLSDYDINLAFMINRGSSTLLGNRYCIRNLYAIEYLRLTPVPISLRLKSVKPIGNKICSQN